MTKKSNKKFFKLHSDTGKLDIPQIICSIRSHIMISMTIPLLCLVLLGSAIYIYSYKSSVYQYNSFTNKLLRETVTYTNDFMNDVNLSSTNILSDPQFIDFYSNNNSDKYNDIQRDFYLDISNNSSIVDGFFISARNSNHISTNDSIIFASDAYSRLKNSNDYSLISSVHNGVWLANSDFLSQYYNDIGDHTSPLSSSFSLLCELHDNSNNILGYLYLVVDSNKIASILDDYNDIDNSYIVLTGTNNGETALVKDLDSLNYQTIIVNTVSYDKVVSSTDNDGYFDINYNSKSYNLHFININDSGCLYILLTPTANIIHQSNIIRHISLLFIVLTLILVIIITNLLIRRINMNFRSILEDVVNISKGNYSEYLNFENNDEFSELGKSLNSLIKKELELQEKLLRDDMTGLFDKDAFYEMLGKEILYNQTHDNKKKLSLAIIDIDDFKKVNDTYGHATGDVILCTLSDIMKKYSKRTDYACRYGGEEFAIIFSDTAASDAKDVLDLMLSEFKSMSTNHVSEKLSFSCGIYQSTQDILSAKELFEKADELLYYVKEHGKNRCITHKD